MSSTAASDNPNAPQISLDQYRSELVRLNMTFAAIDDLPIIVPKKDKVLPHHWQSDDVTRTIWQALHFQEKLPAGIAGAERRFVRLKNPGIPDETVTNTMSISIQLLMPGESARPHRHSIVAFRFFISGKAFTTVNGDRVDMEPGDLVLTPFMHWHGHGNDSKEPALWFDGLDLGLVRYLDAIHKEDMVEPQTMNRTGGTKRRYGTAGMRPSVDLDKGLSRASMIHYQWKDTVKLLNAMAEAGDSNAFDDISADYINPYNGEPAFATLALRAQMIRPGVTTYKRRQTGHKVYYVMEGSGKTTVGDKTFEWKKGDFFVVPSMHWSHHQNANGKPAYLFSTQDDPTLRKLGLYFEEAEAGVSATDNPKERR
jgi:gentisate 1,2-dioxygenase